MGGDCYLFEVGFIYIFMEINVFYSVFFQPDRCNFFHSQSILSVIWALFFQGQDVKGTCNV